MKTTSTAVVFRATLAAFIVLVIATVIISFTKTASNNAASCAVPEQPCIMKTIFGLNGEATIEKIDTVRLSAEVTGAIGNGLEWIAAAQSPDGGWGAGSYTRQNVMDPHKVSPDPATTAIVSIALLRTGNTLTEGKFSPQLKQATLFLLKAVEQWRDDQPRLTILEETQPQRKLGQNIDAILTAQYFTTLLKYPQHKDWNDRVKQALAKCVTRIEKEQDSDGGWKGGGWAPVLQSALADNALESAKDAGIAVDSVVMANSKNYQKSNFDTATKSAVTGKAAGVMLYSLSGTTRSSAKEAKKAKDVLANAKKEGKLADKDELSEVNLVRAGVSPAQAQEMIAAYNINESSKREALKEDVMYGFGSNGGEEFLSYLMTGESILVQGAGNEWDQWYSSMSKKIVQIQNNNGSWNGHHCITSPVFCTAACLLILSVQNDMQLAVSN